MSGRVTVNCTLHTTESALEYAYETTRAPRNSLAAASTTFYCYALTTIAVFLSTPC